MLPFGSLVTGVASDESDGDTTYVDARRAEARAAAVPFRRMAKQDGAGKPIERAHACVTPPGRCTPRCDGACKGAGCEQGFGKLSRLQCVPLHKLFAGVATRHAERKGRGRDAQSLRGRRVTHDGRRDQKVKAVSPGGSRALVKRGRGTGRTPVDTWVSIDDCRLPTKHTLTKAERLAIARYLDLRWEGHTPVSQVRYEWTRWRKAHPAAAGDPAEEEAAIFDGEPEEEPEEEDMEFDLFD